MRVKPMVGEVAWFGPRRAGWGWSPVTWQGWVVTAGIIVACIGSTLLRNGVAVAVSFAMIPLLCVLLYVKGTSPGGPAAWRTFQRVRAGELDAAEVEAQPTTRSPIVRIVLALGVGLVVCVFALLALVMAAPSAISPPTSVQVKDGRLAVDVRGPYVLFALRSGISVPLSSITFVRYDPKARDLPRGRRFGTYIPGGLIAGSFGGGDAKAFWALQHHGALVITVKGGSFSTLVIEVRHPADVVRALADAGVPTLNAR